MSHFYSRFPFFSLFINWDWSGWKVIRAIKTWHDEVLTGSDCMTLILMLLLLSEFFECSLVPGTNNSKEYNNNNNNRFIITTIGPTRHSLLVTKEF